MKQLMVLFSIAALAACSVSEDEMKAASTSAVAAAEADDINNEYKKTQDFDSIAEKSVEGIDTTGFDALEAQ